MKIGTVIAIYFVIWWTVLFAVLPWGMRTQEEEGEVTLGTPESAPANPHILKKAIWTSIVAAVVMAAAWLAGTAFGVTFEEMVAAVARLWQ